MGYARRSAQPTEPVIVEVKTKMNEDILAGKWKQARGHVRDWWGKLTDDDVARLTGKTDQLAGVLQERYGWSRERANDEINRRLREMDKESVHTPR